MKRAGSSNELPALFAFAGQMLFLRENALFCLWRTADLRHSL